MDFGMKLYTEKLASRICDGSIGRILSVRYGEETVRHFRQFVAVTHPNHLAGIHLRKQRRIPYDLHLRPPVFTLVALLDTSAELVRHQLHPVTDAEHGNTEVPNRRVAVRR